MNTKYLHRFGGFILAALLLTGIAFTSSMTAQAQGRYHRRVIVVRPISPFRPFGRPYERYDYYNQYVFNSSEVAMDQGYHDGYKTGSEDGRKNKSYDPERSHYFHDAGFGNFAEAYREGFVRGYREGYGPA
jgi:hypothetical protein